MLEAVGHPVAVNPDRVLAKVARERDWEVMQFTKPVRLRDRVSVPSLVDDRRRGRRHRRRRRSGALVAWRLARRPAADNASLVEAARRCRAARGLLRKDGAAWRRRHPGQR